MRAHHARCVRPRWERDASVYLLSGSEAGAARPGAAVYSPPAARQPPPACGPLPSPSSCPPASGEPPSPGHVLAAGRQRDKTLKGARSLSSSISVSFRLSILSSSLSPFQLLFHPSFSYFSLFPRVSAGFLLSVWFRLEPRVRAAGPSEQQTRVCDLQRPAQDLLAPPPPKKRILKAGKSCRSSPKL